MIYTYVLDSGKLNIHTPSGGNDLNNIKKEILSHTSTEIVTRATYPDGLVLEIHQKANQIVVYSNRQLTENPDGSYSAPEQ